MANNKITKQVNYNVAIGKHFHTIAEGCAAFGLKPDKQGWQILAGTRFEHATPPDKALKDVILWFPNKRNAYWNNASPSQLDRIVETPKNTTKNQKQVDKFLNKYELRITFLKDKGDYRFVGVYELDIDETQIQNKCIWKRVLCQFSADLHEIKEYLLTR